LYEVSQQMLGVLDHQNKQQPIMVLVLRTGEQEGKKNMIDDDRRQRTSRGSSDTSAIASRWGQGVLTTFSYPTSTQ